MSDKNNALLYWLHNDGCAASESDGYVGVTHRYVARVREHRKSGKWRAAYDAKRVDLVSTRAQLELPYGII